AILDNIILISAGNVSLALGAVLDPSPFKKYSETVNGLNELKLGYGTVGCGFSTLMSEVYSSLNFCQAPILVSVQDLAKGKKFARLLI
ncbi:MAG: hypothetical protein ACRDFB_03425, partial [Rhabdochlamydiaceae bacterium]